MQQTSAGQVDSKQLKAQLKQQIKAWSADFSAQHGRTPTQQDIAESPIADVYQQYQLQKKPSKLRSLFEQSFQASEQPTTPAQTAPLNGEAGPGSGSDLTLNYTLNAVEQLEQSWRRKYDARGETIAQLEAALHSKTDELSAVKSQHKATAAQLQQQLAVTNSQLKRTVALLQKTGIENKMLKADKTKQAKTIDKTFKERDGLRVELNILDTYQRNKLNDLHNRLANITRSVQQDATSPISSLSPMSSLSLKSKAKSNHQPSQALTVQLLSKFSRDDQTDNSSPAREAPSSPAQPVPSPVQSESGNVYSSLSGHERHRSNEGSVSHFRRLSSSSMPPDLIEMEKEVEDFEQLIASRDRKISAKDGPEVSERVRRHEAEIRRQKSATTNLLSPTSSEPPPPQEQPS